MQYETEQRPGRPGAQRPRPRAASPSSPSPAPARCWPWPTWSATPKTGDIVDLAATTPPLTTVYEPGSVMKMVTVVRRARDRAWSRPDDHDRRAGQPTRSATPPSPTPRTTAPSSMTVAQILAQSSNIGTIKIAQKLGKQALYDDLSDFGFGTADRARLPQRGRRHRARRPTSGRARRSAPSRSARACRPRRCRCSSAYNIIANRRHLRGAPAGATRTIDADGRSTRWPSTTGIACCRRPPRTR